MMAVIINELDVVVSEPPRTGPPGAATAAPSLPVPTARDLAGVIRHLAERAERTRAD
jgi:hypothetical protein